MEFAEVLQTAGNVSLLLGVIDTVDVEGEDDVDLGEVDDLVMGVVVNVLGGRGVVLTDCL